MDGHQGHAVPVAVLVRVLVCQEGDFGQEVGQPGAGISFFQALGTEVAQAVGQFLDILLAALVFGTVVLADVGDNPRPADDFRPGLVGRPGGGQHGTFLYQGAESLQFAERSLVQGHFVFLGGAEHGPGTDVVRVGSLQEASYGGVADTSGGIVDDALQSLFVVGIHRQAEVW